MNILIISYAFPPDMNSQAQHVYGLYRTLSKFANVDVLTSEKNNKIDDKNIFYSNLGKLHRINNNTNAVKNDGISVIKKNNKIYKLKSCLIPDSVIDWYKEAINYYEKSINKPYDLVIGIATPYTDLLIANKISRKIKKSFKKECKMILVYADPWYGEHSIRKSKLRKLVEIRMETKILKKANKIYMVTNNAKKFYINNYPFIKDKVDYYYLGHNFLPSETKLIQHNNKVKTINYYGTIQSVHRNPYIFFEALDDSKYVGNLKVNLYLTQHISHQKIIDKINESKNLKQIISIKSAVHYKDMIKLAQKCDYNLIFGNSSNLQIPGKLFDYIGLKSNIIYISNNQNSEIEQILKNYNSIIVDNQKKEIKQMFDSIMEDKISLSINENVCKEMYRDECYKKIANYIKNKNI